MYSKSNNPNTDMIRSIQDLESILRSKNEIKTLVLAAGEDQPALLAACKAVDRAFIKLIIVGNQEKIQNLARENGLSLEAVHLVPVPDQEQAVQQAVQIVSRGEGDILMKGATSTAVLLKAVLNKEWGLRKGKLLSHLAIFELPMYHKLLGITDVAINIAPDYEDKLAILKNSISFLRTLGISDPKVALLAAVEKVYDHMPVTLEAAQIVDYFRENPFENSVIEGPLALDNAVNQASARHKGIESKVAGDTDLLLVPQIEAGNILYKSLAFLTPSKVAAVVLGATAPIVLTSRSDSEESKLNSILLAAVGGSISME